MDDINVEANPDYLSIKANVDKSGPDPVVNVDIDLKKDVEEMTIKVSLSAKLGGEFKQISPVKSFNPCKDAVEDEFVKYAMDQIEHYGNLTIACPTKAVIIANLGVLAHDFIPDSGFIGEAAECYSEVAERFGGGGEERNSKC